MKNTSIISSSAYFDTKPHYELLDGLRGVAALLVIVYHVFEGFSFGSGGNIVWINHGYLAVDFFFILSGFVISYAYDERLMTGRLTMRGFFRRRLIRLHPMVVMGSLIGFISYLLQGSEKWSGEHVSISIVMLALLCSIFFIPASQNSCYDVRGNGEMFSLNGPSWSLFFEYIGNVLYVLFIHRLSNKQLAFLTVLLGICLAAYTLCDVSGYGMFGVGWRLDAVNFLGGMIRMMFPFSVGMLIQRCFKPQKVRGAFWICAIILVLIFHVPYIEGNDTICLNGVYEAVCIVLVFPLIIMIAASGATTDSFSTKICKFLGDISFPVYIVHYPLMYLFYSWLIETEQYTFRETWVEVIGVAVGSIILAYVCLKLYDEPIRKWLVSLFK